MRKPWFVFALALAVALPAAAGGTISGTVTLAGGSGPLAVVYVEKGPEPATRAEPARKDMDQRDTDFQPRVLWVRAGDSVQFTNKDNFYHNVFSPTPGNQFDLGLYRGGVAKSLELPRAGEVDVYCNIHPNMKAKLLVVPDGRSTQAAADGTYSLTGLPPGDYLVVAWTAVHEPVRREVRVRAGETAHADFSLKARGAESAHLNKNGEQYGRYK
ncbi:MAG TPA: carboxypeptidase regulatory-like domain-containing protein [Myxococcales bacterium]|nr:carboxypeptidase regulatory-like domain-containing protein [Myxococcales bacterium]